MVKNFAVLVSFSFLMVSCISDTYKEVPKVDLSQLPQDTSEVLPKALEVEGTIPLWLKGTLIRNGPGILKDKDSYVKHWFDGLGKLEAFSINDCKVVYSCRFIESDTYKAYKKTGKFDFNGFAQTASSSQFSIIDFLLGSKNETINNANVNVAEINQRFVALTEVPLPVEFDKDLNTVNYFDYTPREWKSCKLENFC